jgi:hypothetical protein
MRSVRAFALAGLTASVVLIACPERAAAQVEVCGDGVDNDSDGITDNGCYPLGVLGVCETSHSGGGRRGVPAVQLSRLL